MLSFIIRGKMDIIPNTIILGNYGLVKEFIGKITAFPILRKEVIEFISNVIDTLRIHNDVYERLLKCTFDFRQQYVHLLTNHEQSKLDTIAVEFSIGMLRHYESIRIYLIDNGRVPYRFRELINFDIILSFDKGNSNTHMRKPLLLTNQ